MVPLGLRLTLVVFLRLTLISKQLFFRGAPTANKFTELKWKWKLSGTEPMITRETRLQTLHVRLSREAIFPFNSLPSQYRNHVLGLKFRLSNLKAVALEQNFRIKPSKAGNVVSI